MRASEALAAAGRAERRLAELRARLDEGLRPTRRGGGGGRGPSDPTAALALYRLQAAPEVASEMRALAEQAEDGERLLRAVAAAFGPGRAGMLRMRFYDRAAWAAVGAAFGCSRTTAQRRCDVALDWLDSAPPSTICCARGGFAEY